MEAFIQQYGLNDWKVFIDSSKMGFQALMAHNRTAHPAVLIVRICLSYEGII
jgi:hypothetical protein